MLPFCFFPVHLFSFNMYKLVQLLFSMYHKINHICMTIRMGKIYIHLLVTHITLARECILHGTKGETLRKRNDTSNSPKRALSESVNAPANCIAESHAMAAPFSLIKTTQTPRRSFKLFYIFRSGMR